LCLCIHAEQTQQQAETGEVFENLHVYLLFTN
jgi:hypothetical protein